MRATTSSFGMLLCAFLFLGLGCKDERGRNERGTLRERDAPAARGVVRRDLNALNSGVRRAAEILKRGFLVEDREQRERELRLMLRRLQQPQSRHAIDGLMGTPITFVAAVDTNGRVICRDAEEDHMRGVDLGATAPIVRQALRGEAGYALSRLPSLEEGGLPSVTLIFAAPARVDDRVVGAVAAGLPLWRIGQQISRQLQLENSEERDRGHQMWALLYDDEEELHYHAGFPPTLIELTPSAADRSAGLRASPGGYTGEFQQFGRWYGYAVLPMPAIHEEAGVVLFRSEP